MFTIFEDLAAVPPFSPDLEATADTGAVLRLRQQISEADAVVISSPEYAHGIPGVLKNGIDWLVGTGEFYRKPVILVQASTQSVHILPSLKQVLAAVDAQLIQEAEIVIDLRTTPQTQIIRVLEASAQALLRAVRQSISEPSVSRDEKM